MTTCNDIYIIILLIILFILINNNTNYIENYNDCKLLTCIDGYENINNACVLINKLYTMTTFTFSTCGSSGATGPTLEKMQKYYLTDNIVNPNSTWTQNVAYLNMTR